MSCIDWAYTSFDDPNLVPVRTMLVEYRSLEGSGNANENFQGGDIADSAIPALLACSRNCNAANVMP